jgi:hypothetical protein
MLSMLQRETPARRPKDSACKGSFDFAVIHFVDNYFAQDDKAHS